ncbi:tyrosine-type recombinase/integrase [Bremerella sp. T1]|uniref:tyrosine-type recombinase/integrase n=1 Tax=Bremerella sp. TYQ1 TaxID=3119568 RepID=UPI001CCDCBE9|nr:site-specific integrase [Bremerella volcania]UBM38363.1 site-specific integrase [Bremerella volcania]
MATNTEKAKRLPFSKTRVAALPVPESGRRYYYDSKTPGLAVCVTSTGNRTFYVYRKIDGRPIRLKLEKFPEMSVEQAQKKAKQVMGRMVDGWDPQAAKRSRRDAPTLKDLYEHWLTHAKQHKKTWPEDERKWKQHFTKLKNRRLSDLTMADVAKWHASLGEKNGPYLANRARSLLSSLYSKAHELGHNGPNPCLHVKPFKETSRERFLQVDEMRPFFTALASEPAVWRDFWLMCLFTGARRGNVASMAWKDLALEQGVWLVPGDQMKNGQPQSVVLPPPAIQLLQQRSEDRTGPWVFPSKRTPDQPIQDPRKSWARVTAAAGLEDLRPHDLRRTLGSWQAIAGASLQVIGASLGHKDLKSTAVYSRLQLDPVRVSVEGVTQQMLEAAKPKDGEA